MKKGIVAFVSAVAILTACAAKEPEVYIIPEPEGTGAEAEVPEAPDVLHGYEPGGEIMAAPEGFIPPEGMAAQVLVPYYNTTTGEQWTAPTAGWTAPAGWEIDTSAGQVQ